MENNTPKKEKRVSVNEKKVVSLNPNYIMKISLNLFLFTKKIDSIIMEKDNPNSFKKLELLKNEMENFDTKMLKELNIKFTKKEKEKALNLFEIMQ